MNTSVVYTSATNASVTNVNARKVRKYFPWKALTLKNWLESEMNEGKSLHDLEGDLKIPQETLWGWLTLSSQAITLEHIQQIAQYIREDFDTTIQWLGICSMHIEQLIALNT